MIENSEPARLARAAGARGRCGMVISGVLGMMGLAAVGPQVASGQTPDRTNAVSRSIAALPQPVVTTAFLLPAHPIDWSQYRWWEDCAAAFGRMRDMQTEALGATELALSRRDDTLQALDNYRTDSATVQLPRACLLKIIRVATVPPLLLNMVRGLAIQTHADALLKTIMDRQLAALPPQDTVHRVALLDSVGRQELLGSAHESDIPPEHVRLAREYLAQLDALGPAVWQERINFRDWLLREAVQMRDLDAILAMRREQLQIVQDPAVQRRSELQQPMRPGMPPSNVVLVHLYERRFRELSYFKTLSRDSLTVLLAPDSMLSLRFFNNTPLLGDSRILGGPAPALSCDYYYPTPQSAIPAPAAPAALPPHGQLGVVFYFDRHYWKDVGYFAGLRRLQRDLPTLSITWVASTEGSIGSYAGNVLMQDPAEEAKLLHQEIADSLALPGALCVDKSPITKTPERHAIVEIDPDSVTSRQFERGHRGYVVDFTGTVIGYLDVWPKFEGSSWSGSWGPDLLWYLRRVQEKEAASADAH